MGSIKLTRMSVNTTYPHKRKLNPGSPPKVIRKAKDGLEIEQMPNGGNIPYASNQQIQRENYLDYNNLSRPGKESYNEMLARYVAMYGPKGKDRLDQELQNSRPVNKIYSYEPSQTIKNTKAVLGAASLATAALPEVSYLANVIGSLYDFGTAGRYALDHNYEKAAEDAGQALLGLVPGAKNKVVNTGLKVLQGANDAENIREAFKFGGKIKRMPNGGTIKDSIPSSVKLPSADISNTIQPYILPTVDVSPSEKLNDIEEEAYAKYASKSPKIYTGKKNIGPLTQGKMKGAKVNEDMLNDIVAAADKAGVPRDQMLALVANETMFGKARTINDEGDTDQQNTISGWNFDINNKPYDLAKFAFDKKLPGTGYRKGRLGYEYYTNNSDKTLDSAFTVHPEWIQEYQHKQDSVKPQGDINYYELAAEALKKNGLESSSFNPGDPNYKQRILDLAEQIKKEPSLKAYLNKKEYGGEINTNIQTMAGGGLSRKKDYGSKEKPYPSVSKDDFAGGGRSYPIPTRADAVDALRLAGLHHRADVKAKVYKKYPDLKKAADGALIEGDPTAPTDTNPLVAPKGYKPLNLQQRTDWNSFVQHLNRDLKIGGNKSLDDRTNATGLNYLKEYAKANPNFSVTPEMVPYVQYEMQRLKAGQPLDGQNLTSNGVKQLVYGYYNGRDVSSPDGWIGSLTSREGYPIVSNFANDKTGKVWGLDYQGANDYELANYKQQNKLQVSQVNPPSQKYGGETEDMFDFTLGKVPNIWGPGIPQGADGLQVQADDWMYPNYDEDVDYPDNPNIPQAKSGIHIKKENRGKFTATKKATGKTTEELTHSKNPLTRKRAIFAQNARKWHHGKYGLQVMDLGGIPDSTDPDFAQKMQQFLQDNPNFNLNQFGQATPSTPPGVTGQQVDLQGPSSFNDSNLIHPAIRQPSDNLNEQQGKQKKFNVNIPNVDFGNAVKGLAQGADLLVSKFIDEPRKRANEMRLFRNQLTGVNSKPSQGGYDMPVLAKSGIQITSAYTDNGIPVQSRTARPFGNTADNFKTDDPNAANVQVEDGEFLELPTGQTSNINGDLHSDPSGGELMRLPEGSRVYSDSIKVDLSFAKDLTGSKFKRKRTVADLAKKYNTDHEEGILKDPTSDNISKRSANIMKTFKQSQLQQLFDYQEATKDPMYMLNKDNTAEDYLGSNDTVVAKKGVKVMADGGQEGDPPSKLRRRLNVVRPGEYYYTPNGGTQQVTTPGGITSPEGFTTMQAPQGFGSPFSSTIPRDNNSPYDLMWWNARTGNMSSSFPDTPGVNTQGLEQPTSTPKLTTPTSTPDSTPWTPIDLTTIRGVTPPQLQVKVPPTTVQPGTLIDSSKYPKPIHDNNKVNPPQPQPKVPWGNTLGDIGEIAPELFALAQNQTDFPIFTSKYQPKYLNPVEMNIQANLNANYAQTQPYLQSTGNDATDSARQAQAIANLYDANNQVFQQKYNFDTNNRYQTDATNLQIENEANRYNLQRADDFWNKVTQRQAVKEATNNNIVNSAYAKFKRKQLENRSLQLTNQMFDNFKYDPQRGVYFDQKSGQQYVFHEPTGQFINIGTSSGDGVETTTTTRNTPKGTTQTIRNKEKQGY